MRIASLLASGTELVCALGAGRPARRALARVRLPGVGAARCRRQPADVRRHRHERRDRRASCARGCAPASRSTRSTRRRWPRFAPTCIITQTHCEVCAVSPGDLAHGAPHAPLERQQVVALRAGTLDGILDGLRRSRRRARRARRRAARSSRGSARAARRRAARHARCAAPDGRLPGVDRPALPDGQLGARAGRAARAAHVLGAAGRPLDHGAWDAVRARRSRRAGRRAVRLRARRARCARCRRWRRSPAGASCAPCAPAACSWPTETSTSTARARACSRRPSILAEMLHPGRFPPVHEGTAWQRYGG